MVPSSLSAPRHTAGVLTTPKLLVATWTGPPLPSSILHLDQSAGVLWDSALGLSPPLSNPFPTLSTLTLCTQLSLHIIRGHCYRLCFFFFSFIIYVVLEMVRSWQLFHQFLQCQRKTKYLKRKDMKQTNPNQPQVPNFLLKTHSGKKKHSCRFCILFHYVRLCCFSS